MIHSDTVWERALSTNLSVLLDLELHIPPSFVHRDNNSIWEREGGYGADRGDLVTFPTTAITTYGGCSVT